MLQNKEYYAPVLEEEEGFVDEKGQAAEDGKTVAQSDEQPIRESAAGTGSGT